MARHAVTIAASLLIGFQATSGQFPPPGSQYMDRQNLFVYHPDCGSISIFRIPCLDKAAQDVYGMKQNDQVEVELDLDIVDISSLDVVEEEISVEINLIQSWTDTRCRFEVLL